MFGFLKSLFAKTPQVDLSAIIQSGAWLVDVRSPAEFAAGHVKGSVNIPLDQVEKRIADFRKKSAVIVFCQSGMRSSRALAILRQNGLKNVFNGGTWTQMLKFVK